MESIKVKQYLVPEDKEVAAIISEKCFMPLKSEKARLYVLNPELYGIDVYVPFEIDYSGDRYTDVAFNAIYIAEAEMRERAIEAHRQCCNDLAISKLCSIQGYPNYLQCNGECDYMRDFLAAF